MSQQVEEKMLNIIHPQGNANKTIMRHYFTPVRMVTTKKRTIIIFSEDVKKSEHLYTIGLLPPFITLATSGSAHPFPLLLSEGNVSSFLV